MTQDKLYSVRCEPYVAQEVRAWLFANAGMTGLTVGQFIFIAQMRTEEITFLTIKYGKDVEIMEYKGRPV